MLWAVQAHRRCRHTSKISMVMLHACDLDAVSRPLDDSMLGVAKTLFMEDRAFAGPIISVRSTQQQGVIPQVDTSC